MHSFDYIKNLISDLAEQFKEQPNIVALCEVIGKQLQDVWKFFDDMDLYRRIDSAVGAQLDNIGKSVGMSREDAIKMAEGAGFVFATEDDLYRAYIKYQISLYSSNGTYASVVNSIRMQTDSGFIYNEEPTLPATILLGYDMFNGEDHNNISNIPIARPAGVGVRFKASFNGADSLYVAGGSVEASRIQYSMTEREPLPNYLCDENYNLLCDGNWWILCEDGDDY
jgi:hypothetical protein